MFVYNDSMFTVIEQLRTSLGLLARDFEPTAFDASGAVRIMTEFATMQRLLDGLIARCAKRVDDTNAHARTADVSGAALAARLVGVEASRMQHAVATATALESLPATAEAVKSGRLSGREAELIAAAASHNPHAERELLDVAPQGLVKLKTACIKARARAESATTRRARMHASRSWTSYIAADGMFHGHLTVPPEIGAQIDANIQRDVQHAFRRRRKQGEHEPLDRYASDVVSRLLGACPSQLVQSRTESVGCKLGTETDLKLASASITNATNATNATRTTNAQIHILIDHQTLIFGSMHDATQCEIPGVGPVDAQWVRSLLGTAFVTAIIRRGKDIRTVAHLGRHIPVELQTALIVGGRECSVEGCNARRYLERDHTHDHAKGGPTSLNNLDWLCSHHHRLKTAKGHRLGPKHPETGKRILEPPQARAG